MKMIAITLLLIVLVIMFVYKPWKIRHTEEKWRNSPSPETNDKIEQIIKSKENKENESEFYH
jgi:hypothetical protein